MAKDGIEQHGLREKGAVLMSLSIHTPLQLTRTEERVEREEKKEEQWSASSNPHAMIKDGASERSDTQENMNTQIHS